MGAGICTLRRTGDGQLSGADNADGEEIQRQFAGRERQRAALCGRDAEQRTAGGDGTDAGTGKTAAREIKMGPLRESGGASLCKEGWNCR